MEKEKLLFAALEIRKLVVLLDDMYGNLGVGAVYDTMRDRASELEKLANEEI